MKRIIFKVVNASAEENQNGSFHFSKPFKTLEEARTYAQKIKDDWVVIEKRTEIYNPAPIGMKWKNDDYGWELAEDGMETVEYL